MFDVVLYEPEIPSNTGNAVRLCAATGARLHLVRPLGFSLNDRALRRAGLDYHEHAALSVHDSWQACCGRLGASVYAFTTKATRGYALARFAPGDVLLFGPETRGLPVELLDALADEQKLRLPMLPGRRSLNLANAVAVVVYEAWRQNGFREGG